MDIEVEVYQHVSIPFYTDDDPDDVDDDYKDSDDNLIRLSFQI